MESSLYLKEAELTRSFLASQFEISGLISVTDSRKRLEVDWPKRFNIIQELEKSACKRARKSADESESNDVKLETYEEEAEMDVEHAYEETEAESEENMMWKDNEESRSCLMIGGEWMASNVRICV